MAKEQVAKKESFGFDMKSLFKTPDVQFALAIIGIILIMIVPLHPMILDILLAISITFSVLMLLMSVYVQEPLEFSTFPTLLLITTLFRLALNIATTRSILLDGATGHVSMLVKSFGDFVVGGNFIVGFVIFTILVIINFIVITKGAGRVAEVGARFTLDAMPGKQMSIDADLNAGVIDREEAKRRRKKIEEEADFYGSMDGASKFVRGDAIASIIIAVVNILVGLILGVTTYGMDFQESARVFTLLTVGDGLVSQIPALVISTAAGIVVTRSGGGAGLSTTISRQISTNYKAVYICAAVILLFVFIPGLPSIPFLMLSGAIFYFGRFAKASSERYIEQLKNEKDLSKIEPSSPDSIENLLHIDDLALEVGVGLIPLVDTKQSGEVLERIVSSRKQFAQEMGIVVPMVMVRDNIQLRPGEYQILLKGNKIGGGNLMVDYFLAMDPGDISDPIEGIETLEPAYGLDALWIKNSQKEEASFRGYTVVNCSTVIVTHLTKVIEENAELLIGRQEVQELVENLKVDAPKVVEEVIGADRLTLGEVVRVLQNLLSEKVSIRDLKTIFETLADYCRQIKHPDALTRYVRKALGRTLIQKYSTSENKMTVITLDRAVEDLLVAGLEHRADGTSSLQVDPEIAQKLLTQIAKTSEQFTSYGSQPILLCGSLLRWELKQLINRFIPGMTVIAFDEIPGGIETKSIGLVSL